MFESFYWGLHWASRSCWNGCGLKFCFNWETLLFQISNKYKFQFFSLIHVVTRDFFPPSVFKSVIIFQSLFCLQLTVHVDPEKIIWNICFQNWFVCGYCVIFWEIQIVLKNVGTYLNSNTKNMVFEGSIFSKAKSTVLKVQQYTCQRFLS